MTDEQNDIVAELRGWWNTDHEADGRGFCRVCSLRMPCDWVQIVDDAITAADEIERLRLEVHLHDGRIEALEEAAKMDCGSPVPSDLTCIGMRRETRWTCAPCFARRVLGRTDD